MPISALLMAAIRGAAVAQAPAPTPTPSPSFTPSSFYSGGRNGCAFDVAHSAIFQDEAETTPAAANSDPVAKISDVSGNGHPASINGRAATTRPAFKTASLSYIEFTKSEVDRLNTGAWSAMPAAWDRVSLLRLPTGVGANDVIFASNGGGLGYLYVQSVSAPNATLMMNGNGAGCTLIVPLNTWVVITERFAGANSKIRRNNLAYSALGNVGNTTMNGICVGSDGGGGGFPARVDKHAMYLGVFTDDECNAIAAELMGRAGL